MTINHRPVGTWRFLTPLDTIQIGDLGRYMCGEDFHDHNWSVVDDDTEWAMVGTMAEPIIGQHPTKDWEFIRLLDGTITEINKEEVSDGA